MSKNKKDLHLLNNSECDNLPNSEIEMSGRFVSPNAEVNASVKVTGILDDLSEVFVRNYFIVPCVPLFLSCVLCKLVDSKSFLYYIVIGVLCFMALYSMACALLHLINHHKDI